MDDNKRPRPKVSRDDDWVQIDNVFFRESKLTAIEFGAREFESFRRIGVRLHCEGSSVFFACPSEHLPRLRTDLLAVLELDDFREHAPDRRPLPPPDKYEEEPSHHNGIFIFFQR